MLWLIGHGPEEGPEGPCFLTCRATREGVNVGRGQVWGRRGQSWMCGMAAGDLHRTCPVGRWSLCEAGKGLGRRQFGCHRLQ